MNCFIFFNLQEQVTAEEEGEEEFVLLKQRAADVAVEVVGKMTVQVLKSPLQDLGLNAEEKTKERQLLMLEMSLSVKTVRRNV